MEIYFDGFSASSLVVIDEAAQVCRSFPSLAALQNKVCYG